MSIHVASLCLRCIHKLVMHKKQRRNEENYGLYSDNQCLE